MYKSCDWTYYTYNIENQLTIEEKGGIATYYTYDPAGALLSKKTGEDESNYDYTYEGLMKEFTNGEDVATYKFDTQSRRIEKTVGETTTKFEYNGADVVAEYDGSDTIQVTFNTPSIDQNLTQKRSGSIYFYLHDGLGSVRNLLDSNEVIKNIYDYVAFGAVHGNPTETIVNPFRFTSRRWDSESLLHYYRARVYNQLVGRFISKDPIFLTNLYVYVINNPILLTDPDGTKAILNYNLVGSNAMTEEQCLDFYLLKKLDCIESPSSIKEKKACLDKAYKEYQKCVMRAKGYTEEAIWHIQNYKGSLNMDYDECCYMGENCKMLFKQETQELLENALAILQNPLIDFELWEPFESEFYDRLNKFLRDCLIGVLTAKTKQILCSNDYCVKNGKLIYGQNPGIGSKQLGVYCGSIMLKQEPNRSIEQMFCDTIIHEAIHSCGYTVSEKKTKEKMRELCTKL